MREDYLSRLKGEYEKESRLFSEKLKNKRVNVL
jgi:hypothetical protein